MSPSTIHDFGGADPDRLDNPPLGGTGGWADAVRNDLVRLEAEKATDADVAAVAATVPAAIADHEAKPDPHPVYLKPSEIVAGANITVTENAGVVTIAGQAGGGGGGSSVSGGSVAVVGQWTVHTFTADGSFDVVGDPRDVEVLIVGGGGGGGMYYGGGGGGGGCVTQSLTVSGASPVVVGSGGAGATADNVKGGTGGASSVFGFTAAGGGGGGSYNSRDGGAGGSGGGANLYGGAAGAATPSGQGYPGGVGNAGDRAGGGGGASATPTDSAGGAGITSSISGQSLVYGAGGGGSYSGAGAGLGAGGSGGVGGNGGSGAAPAPGAGMAGRGGGGGGAGGTGTPGAAGGAGIVIIRYLTAAPGASAALDDLTDVTAPANTPAGKVLGTTAEGVWEPIDPPAGGGGGGVGDSGWVDYTPVLSGWTLGNGTLVGRYRQVGQMVTVDVVLTLGSSSVYAGGQPSITTPPDLPVHRSAGDLTVRFHDNGTAWYSGASTPGADKTTIYARATSNGQLGGVGGGTPFTWVPGDQILLAGSYFTNAPALGDSTALDDLTDVSAPADTPAGKVLGTTAEGVWGPAAPYWTGTQAQYDALAVKDPNVLYIVSG